MNNDSFRDANVLITGGLGFIGSNLAHSLASLGAQVTLADSLVPEYGGNLFNISGLEDQVRVNISDVRDVHSMRYLIQRQDFLFNLAGQDQSYRFDAGPVYGSGHQLPCPTLNPRSMPNS
jgi:UDP-glucose 4-epimerase